MPSRSVKTIKLLWFILLIIMTTHGQLIGSDLTKEFKADVGFTLFLTQDWIEIPKDVLDSYSKSFAVKTGSSEERWNYGYQLVSKKKWLQYPYALIRINESGRVPELELENLQKIDVDMQKSVQEVEQTSKGILTKLQLGGTYYDYRDHIIFSAVKVNVRGAGDVIVFTALKLTKKGFIQFAGYALEEDGDKFMDFFKNAAHQMKLSSELEYRDEKSKVVDNDRQQIWKVLIFVIIITLSIGAMIRWRFLRKK